MPQDRYYEILAFLEAQAGCVLDPDDLMCDYFYMLHHVDAMMALITDKYNVDVDLDIGEAAQMKVGSFVRHVVGLL